MIFRSLLIAVATCASVASMTALAHDPRLHEAAQAPVTAKKAKPATCTELADVQRYSNDVSVPDIKALKARCDAETAPADKEAVIRQ
ncbi:hypothetical protein [Rhodanobacter sp. UC4436_H3]